MSYRLVTDATADLAPEMLEGLPEISVLPMEILLDGRPYTYGPGGNIGAEEFYQQLEAGSFASTSQINPTQYEEFFLPILEAGQDLLYLCFTSGLSGMYQQAMGCVQRLRSRYPERKILCVDTLCASLGEGFLVREALLRQAQGYNIEELARWVEERRGAVCQWFTVDTFEHLKRGGRVNSATAAVGTMLQIKPLMHVSAQGRLEVADRTVRGARRAQAALLHRVQEGWMPQAGTEVFVGHGGCPQRAEQLAEQIRAELPGVKIWIAPVGPVIGAHTGPGILGLIFWGNTR